MIALFDRPVRNRIRNTNWINPLSKQRSPVKRVSAGDGNGANCPSNNAVYSDISGQHRQPLHRRQHRRKVYRRKASIWTISQVINVMIDHDIYRRCKLLPPSWRVSLEMNEHSRDYYQSQRRTPKDEDQESGKGNSIPHSPVREQDAAYVLEYYPILLYDLFFRYPLGDIEISLCAHLNKSSEITDEIFDAHLISYSDFQANPSIINDSNVVGRINGKWVIDQRAEENSTSNYRRILDSMIGVWSWHWLRQRLSITSNWLLKPWNNSCRRNKSTQARHIRRRAEGGGHFTAKRSVKTRSELFAQLHFTILVGCHQCMPDKHYDWSTSMGSEVRRCA